jgi:DNA-binding MarR family transcriptional regulator
MVKKSSCVKVSTDKDRVQSVVDAIKGDATIFIGETRVKSQVEFVMLFGANFDAVLKKHKFFMNDMRVLFAVLHKMTYGNQLSIKQKSIGAELGMDSSNVSKSWNKLLKAGIFVKDEHGNEFVNFDLFLKGKGKTVAEKFEEQAALSHDVLAKQDIKTKRPFRAKEPEKKPVAKRIPRKVSKKTDIQTDRKF